MFSQRKNWNVWKWRRNAATKQRGDEATRQRIDEATRRRGDITTRSTRLTTRYNDAIQQREWRGDLTTRSDVIDEAIQRRDPATCLTRRSNDAIRREMNCYAAPCGGSCVQSNSKKVQVLLAEKKSAWTDLDRVDFEKNFKESMSKSKNRRGQV